MKLATVKLMQINPNYGSRTSSKNLKGGTGETKTQAASQANVDFKCLLLVQLSWIN